MLLFSKQGIMFEGSKIVDNAIIVLKYFKFSKNSRRLVNAS
jgi:hypothetical protein